MLYNHRACKDADGALKPTPKIILVVGARPQFVKLASIMRALQSAETTRAESGQPCVQAEILHTGQHYDHGMSQVFFDEMEIPHPDANLGIGSGPHGQMTGRMLEALEAEFIRRAPDCVITFGDTNSTLAAALAASKLRIPSAHVEAGLRAFDLAIPEEVNRLVADRVSELLFCPSESSRKNLEAEGIREGVHIVGDVMYDAVKFYEPKAIAPSVKTPFALATLHRAGTVDDPDLLRGVIGALQQCPLPVIFPVHPRTRSRIEQFGLKDLGSIQIVEPLSYFSILGHLKSCDFVLTDSGGLQKEAYFFGKKCITARLETEWTELVDIGANRVVGTDSAAITAAYDWAQQPLASHEEIYGDGTAAEKIVKILYEDLEARG